jgi:hypothetical protein
MSSTSRQPTDNCAACSRPSWWTSPKASGSPPPGLERGPRDQLPETHSHVSDDDGGMFIDGLWKIVYTDGPHPGPPRRVRRTSACSPLPVPRATSSTASYSGTDYVQAAKRVPPARRHARIGSPSGASSCTARKSSLQVAPHRSVRWRDPEDTGAERRSG